MEDDHNQDDALASIPRRRRPALSCTVCRRRKLKCDRALPCGQCVRSKTPDLCVYSSLSNPSTTSSRPRPVADSSDQGHVPSDRASPVNSGLFVFDSKHQNPPSRVSKPKGRPDELQELRNRVRSLEQALARTGSARTPESLAYDSVPDFGMQMRMTLDNQDVTQEVRNLPENACFRGRNGRTRFRGRSSAELTLSCLDDMAAYFAKNHHKMKSESSEFHKMKKFRGELRSREKQDQQRAYQERACSLKEMLPPRNIADELLKLYLSTFETTYRILHVPTFLKQYDSYWAGETTTTDQIFIAKLLALMAASSCYFSPATKVNGTDTLHHIAVGWLLAVQSWMASSFVGSTVKFDMLQIQCLLILARQAHAADGDVVCITSGSVVRTAMVMGMHRNPLRFSKMTHFWAEMRRRLWATILELDLQASIDSGMPPSIDLDQYDCDLPSNCDDADLIEDMPEAPVPKGSEVLTRSTFLAVLSRSLPLRVRIARAMNSLKFTLSYDEALRLSEDLFQAFNGSLAHFPPKLDDDGSAFARSFMSFVMQRFILLLHRPFALSIALSPKFSYSRKVCMESSLEMLYQLELPESALLDQVHPCLGHLNGGMFRDESFHSALTVCAELCLQTREFSASKPAQSFHANSLNELVRSQQNVLVRVLERTLDTFGSRISPKGNGCKGFVFLSMALASVKARLGGENPMKKIEEASLRSIKMCEQVICGVPWVDLRRQIEGEFVPSVTHTPDMSSAASDVSFDPFSFFSSNSLDLSPLDFGNMFDAADYKMPELWDPNFLAI